METIDAYMKRDDLTTCSGCGKTMFLPYGAGKCPACRKGGCLVWTDKSSREADINSLFKRHCNLHQKSELQPEEYFSLSILMTEYIPYLADRPQIMRETLLLLFEIGPPFEKYWQGTRCFQFENIYTPVIRILLDKLDMKLREGDMIPVEYQDCRSPEDFPRAVADGCPAKEEVSLSSDKEGNYYLSGRKVGVENSDEYVYRLLEAKIQTSYRRPVNSCFRFLVRFGPYGTHGNVYYPSIMDPMYRRYLPETTR